MIVDGVAAFKRLVKLLGIIGIALFAGSFIVMYLTHLFWVIATFTPICLRPHSHYILPGNIYRITNVQMQMQCTNMHSTSEVTATQALCSWSLKHLVVFAARLP